MFFFESIIIDNLFLMEAYKRREHDNWNYALPSKVKKYTKNKILRRILQTTLSR
jgi:hypothetical protein